MKSNGDGEGEDSGGGNGEGKGGRGARGWHSTSSGYIWRLWEKEQKKKPKLFFLYFIKCNNYGKISLTPTFC